MFNRSKAINYLLRWAILILLGLLIYGQTFQYNFVFDDNTFIVNNPYIRSFSQVPLIWHFYPMTRAVGFYSFALNYSFNQLSPQGYHILNFIVHLLAVGLVWGLAGLLVRITKWPPAQGPLTNELPYIIAVLFLVHPCQTQAVSYISQRFESMATVFYLGTIYCYLSARVSTGGLQQAILFGLAGFFTILGIFTKEVVITLPAMILACEWILFPKKDNKKFYIILIFAGVLLFTLFIKLLHTNFSIFLRSIPSQSHDGDILTPSGYFLTQMRVFLTFLRLLILPVHQNLDYDYPASTGLLSPPLTLLGLCAIVFIIFLVLKLRREFPLIAFGLAWILITFSINLAPRENLIFEHKLYLISFGFFLALTAGLFILVDNRRLLTGIFLCVITALSIASFQRNKIWKDDMSLWNDVVQKSPHKSRGYNNRGFQYYLQGNFTQALDDFSQAIQINPDYAEAYNNRGVLYGLKGNFTQAISDADKAIELKPDYRDAYKNRAISYGKLQQANGGMNHIP